MKQVFPFNKIFLTGGSGFVGQRLLAKLRDIGCTVVCLARSEKAAIAVTASGGTPFGCDLCSGENLAEGMAGCEAVYHLAAKVEFWGPSEDFHRVNVTGTEHLLKAAKEAGVKAFIDLSAAAVIMSDTPLIDADESYPLSPQPIGNYIRSKILAEQIIREVATPSFRTISIRPPLIWGKGDNNVLPALIEAVQKKRFVWIDGGNYPYSTCHVENVCEGLLLAASHGQNGEAYFVTDGEPILFRDFVTRLLATQGIAIKTLSVPRSVALASASVMEYVWSGLKLKTLPPMTRELVKLIGEPIVISDLKARRELAYLGSFTREKGFRELENTSQNTRK